MGQSQNVVPAWGLIGHEGKFRIVGGRRVYEAVMYNVATARSDRVRLAYLSTAGGVLRQVNRWVDADTLIEVIEDFDAETPQPEVWIPGQPTSGPFIPSGE